MASPEKPETLREFDRVLIQKQITKLNYSDIADILDVPVSLVEDYAKEYLQGKNIRPVAVKKIKDAEAKVLKVAKAKQEKPVVIRGPKRELSKYKTKVVDMNALIGVKIDAKTTIWITPDQDKEKEKAKYIQRMIKPIDPEAVERAAAYKKMREKEMARQERLLQIKKSKYPSYYAL